MLKYGLDYIFENFSSNVNSTGINFLKKFSKDEKMIDYNNLFFEIDDTVIKIYNLLKHLLRCIIYWSIYLMKMKHYLILQPFRLIWLR